MKILLRLVPYLRPHAWLILFSTITGIIVGIIRVGPVAFIQQVVDDITINHDSARLLRYSLYFIGLYILNFVFRFIHYYCLRVVIARVNQKIKNELYQHLMGLSADYFTRESTGTLISRVGNDPQYLDAGLSCINILVREPITVGFLFFYALRLNWKMTLVVLAIFPPLAYVFRATAKNLKRYINRMSEENAQLYSTLQESFTGIRVIKSFRLEKFMRKKFRERSESFTRFLLKTAALEEASHPMVEFLTALAISAVIYFGGLQVLRKHMSPGEFLAFFGAFALMIERIRIFNDISIKLSGATAACNRIFEIFDWKSHLHDPDQPFGLKKFDSQIEFQAVTFAYPDSPERHVLKEISFSLPKGGTIALVGKSGSGKSSLVNLLPRIFDVTHGGIRIDGHDIRELHLEDLRRLISVVSQDVFLFNDSIEENIRCGKLSASRQEIREAARRAHALDFIEGLPNGFATVIGDRGQKLSGGEKQRLSIARAFLREAPILILDEATSSLDTHSERAVQSALDGLMKHRTTIIIAHRLSTVQHVDQILVMRDGEIVERGRHEELMASGGEYAKFHHL